LFEHQVESFIKVPMEAKLDFAPKFTTNYGYEFGVFSANIL
jgi:hypothetical protein